MAIAVDFAHVAHNFGLFQEYIINASLLYTQQANECCLRLLSAKYPCDVDFTSQKNIVQKQQIALCGHKMHHVV